MKHIANYKDFLNEGMSDAKVAKLLRSISSERLDDPMEYGEYLKDYYDNPEEYDIDEDGEYYRAIQTAWYQIKDDYSVGNKSTIRNNKIYKLYLRK